MLERLTGTPRSARLSVAFVLCLFLGLACSTEDQGGNGGDDGSVTEISFDTQADADVIWHLDGAPDREADGEPERETVLLETVDTFDTEAASETDSVEDSQETETSDCEPGAPYCPCETDGDCLSTYCIFSPEGKVCASPCIDTCPDGWDCRTVSGVDPVFLCVPAHPTLCLPCRVDGDCGYNGFEPGVLHCIDYGLEVGSFCGGPCDNTPCPSGYSCDLVDGHEECVAEAGVCGCSPWAILGNMVTDCVVANAAGSCSGERRCSADGLSACSAPTPIPEICDAIDNDCDGEADEISELGELSCGLGPCLHSVPACVDGKENTCDAMQGAQAEICDGLDNDCDGLTDESFVDTDGDDMRDCVDPDDDNDGILDDGNGSGNPSDKPCVGGTDTAYCDDNCPLDANANQADLDVDAKGDACDPDVDGDGFAGVALGGQDCDDQDPTVNPGNPEGEAYGMSLCDGRDNDCDGATDEGYANADSDAMVDCVDADDDNDGDPDVSDCAPKNAQISHGIIEICNGLDDDCDGSTDEGFPDTDQDGIKDCVENDLDGDGDPDANDCQPNNAMIFHGQSELCNDVDDNCNEVADEGYSNFDEDAQADCVDPDDDNDGDPDSSDCAPLNDAISSDATEACDGVDNDCDNQTDEGFEDTDQDGLANCLDADDDDDAIMDTRDNCPLNDNFDQVDTDGDLEGDACDTDDDGDGIPDVNDNCPLLANPDVNDTDADGLGDACDNDDDNDGLLDGEDNCPKDVNSQQEDWDEDLIGDACDPDEDGDGVDNDADTCPFYNDQIDSDEDGIPEACEIFFAGHVWPVSGAVFAAGQDLHVFIQIWKAGVTVMDGPAQGLEVVVRYRLAGEATWTESAAAYHKDFDFTDDVGYTGHNEEHTFVVPAAFSAGHAGEDLEIDFIPMDYTGGPSHGHAYNNTPVYDQGWVVGQAKSAAPLTYHIQ